MNTALEDDREPEEINKTKLGVNGSQVQILSARLNNPLAPPCLPGLSDV